VRPLPRRSIALALLLVPALLAADRLAPPDRGRPRDADALAARVESLVRRGALTLARTQADPDFPGRRHLRFDQRVGGVRVFGAQLVQQLDADGRTRSVSGSIAEGLALDTRPRLSADQAQREALAASPRGALSLGEPELVVRAAERRLAWTLWLRLDHDLERVFVDAATGAVLERYSDLRTDSAVGLGSGVWGDQKKLPADRANGVYRADDRLRPCPLTTYDMRYDASLTGTALATGRFESSWIAWDADNAWSDGAVVDAHVHAGWTYDYFYKRHSRRGLDDHNLAVRSIVHPLSPAFQFANAAYDPFANTMIYGDGDSEFAPFSSALDVVAHELAHGVTFHSWDGIYQGESGALNEAFSDIMGTAVEFFHQPAGTGRLHADYALGEDLAYRFDPSRTAVRSMENPGLYCSASLGACDADHYSKRYLGSADSGGIHHNSGIANQAFFLMAEGGVNRTSGQRVAGLGPGGREKAERIVYRGFTAYLTPSATFQDARAATLRAARELYGEAEAAQVAAAWSAVGVE
jgi:Zn-dependent metalloprotease